MEFLFRGLNKRGQLGLGDTATRLVPTAIPFQSDDVSSTTFVIPRRLYADNHSSALIDSEGRLFTWGSNTYNRLMHGPSDLNGPQHVSSPRIVNYCLGNICCDFTFSKTNAAVMLLSQLYGVCIYLYMYIYNHESK